MFGREPERARIEQLLDGASHGPVGIAITGTPGIGKTTMWREALDAAGARGYRVMQTAPSEADAALAFSGLGDLFDGLAEGAWSHLPDRQRRAISTALFLGDSGDAPTEIDALPRAVLGVLRGLAAEATVVVAIDDEQSLDRASARVLAFALRRIRDEQVCLLLSRRADSDGALWAELHDRFAPGVEGVELAGLDLSTTHRLLAASLQHKIPRRVLERVHEISGGNPLYALAIGAELKRTNSGARGLEEIPIPRTLSEAIAQRLGAVRAGAEAPLFAIAALADPTLTLLSAMFDEFDATRLEAAIGAGVIEIAGEHLRFSHPLLASVHYASVPTPRRQELHLRLAGAVTDPEERARHLALGAEGPNENAAREIERAAGLAARRGAPESAAELLGHAIRLTPSDENEVRWSRTLAAAEQHYRAGDHRQVAELIERLLLERPSRPVSARARFQLGLARTDDYDFVASMLDQALADAGDDDRLRAEIEVVYVNSAVNLCDYGGMLRHAQSAVACAERLGEPAPLAAALAALGSALFHCGRGLQHDLFERAIELERSEPLWHFMVYVPSATYGANLRIDDDLDAARPLLEEAVDRMRRQGEEMELTPALWRLARLELSAGNPVTCERWLAEAAEAATQNDDDEMNSWVAEIRAEIAASRGQFDEARLHVEEMLTLANKTRDLQEQREGSVLLAHIELWSGKPAVAHDLLAPQRRSVIENGPWHVSNGVLYLWSSDIEALIALNRLDDAQQVLDDFLARATAGSNPHALAIARRCEGLMLAARGDLERAIAALDVAVAEHARRCIRLELGRTLLEKGSVERRAKRKSAAKRTLEQALALLEPLDAAVWVSRARDELGRIGLRRAAVSEGLTPAQTRVAELVATGLTNQEIANMLYMSTRTVESHLTKIYREYGVRSRAQLVGALANTALRAGADNQ